MSLGISLLLIFILYLIDKHSRWRQAIKIAIGLVVLTLIGVGGKIGWQQYNSYRTEKHNQEEEAAYQLKFKACIAKSTPAGNETAAREHEAACALNPDAPVTIDSSTAQHIPGFMPTLPSGYRIEPHKAQVRHVIAQYDTEITTAEYGTLTSGHVKKGEVVTLLTDDGTTVKVRTASGEAGWALADAFEVTK